MRLLHFKEEDRQYRLRHQIIRNLSRISLSGLHDFGFSLHPTSMPRPSRAIERTQCSWRGIESFLHRFQWLHLH
jgi:hypothetical protein